MKMVLYLQNKTKSLPLATKYKYLLLVHAKAMEGHINNNYYSKRYLNFKANSFLADMEQRVTV